MKHTYSISGMTCANCVASVVAELSKIERVAHVAVNLEKGEAEIEMEEHIPLGILQTALSKKYSIRVKGSGATDTIVDSASEKSKLQQLKPLLLIFLYLCAATFLLHIKNWNTVEAMLDFMGLFYIVFSFFKLLDLKGFSESFCMYDPLAKLIPAYAWAYPFIELGLGLLLLMRVQINAALSVTLVVLGITAIGVSKTLWDKKSIRCACLGTALKLPMTEATFIENAIMLLMALTMLLRSFF